MPIRLSGLDRIWFLGLVAFIFPAVELTMGAIPAVREQPEFVANIPSQGDWTDYGAVFESGELGEWDYILWGAFGGAAIKKNGTYYLYYQGASGYRVLPDETVTWRSIGVATSPDGVNFTKYSGNPVLTWFPNNNGEEGAVSTAPVADDNGDIVMYYGANTEQDAQRINGDGRIGISTNGVNFQDQGIVLDHQDSALWGSGDEVYPIIALHDGGQWIVYYLPNGTPQSGYLGVAWGSSRTNLDNSGPALSGGSMVNEWGMGGAARISPGTYALLLNHVHQSRTEVRTISLSAPDQLSAPVETYQFDEVEQATYLLDEETNTWFMYYRADGYYGLKLAPAGVPDSTPPAPPTGLAATPVSDNQIDLSWNPATDPDTGVVAYRIYRDGLPIATVKGWSYSDVGLEELTSYTYRVSAINYHGFEGAKSAPITASTSGDVTPPGVASVSSGVSATGLVLVFDEPVEESSAETPTNYNISGGVSVTSASLQPNLKTVILTTFPHADGVYNITINNVTDRSAIPNPIPTNTTMSYLVSQISGLAGSWTLNEAIGITAFDTGNYGNDGDLIYTDRPGPSWSIGRIGAALYYDGLDDQVTIPGEGILDDLTDSSYTLAAWVRPETVPPGTTANNTSFSVLVRDYNGLYYDMDRTFRATVRLTDGTRVDVSSSEFNPGTWHHLVMVVDETGKHLHLFVDGVEVSQSPANFTGSLAELGGAPYYLGASEPLTNFYEFRFRGDIDEARVFQRALLPPEVQDLYNWFPGISLEYATHLPIIRG